ncbi:(2Fe-2S)-binding protein [Pseudonocardia benzenivorans]|uniref:(2Fe-2S)-binding domain-containing protein n=2 Tax=Pseudonocardia TaxID=1847 RepID=F4CJR4_PSEUX|nr:2Fe-2S iron-sulfur cluster-binding protein [Pseudonocardia dioxanivorans]AEA25924.1 (2Fe-2S)-binding domain-containing protein [Pseudonocardia dioxanivorans CB1190]GJF04101.1 oxidoreductase [Pseudonocardia sp. D17]
MSTEITLLVNGERRAVPVDDDDLLLDVLRGLGHTSVREGCGVGACGACTVLADGHSVSSCLARAVRYDGAALTTADGLPADDDVVEEFVAARAMQCGYCIPGFVLMTHELLAENPDAGEAEIDAHLEGNICRCGTYLEIRTACVNAARRRREAAHTEKESA